MVDKVFGIDFTNDPNPLSSFTLSVHNGTALVDVTLADILKLSATLIPYRNLSINGDMAVAQRGTSFAGVTGPTYHIDRWLSNVVSLGTWTVSQENDAPTGSGLRKSVKLLVTTADAAPAAGGAVNFQQRFEGQNVQVIRKGTSSAKQISLQFWVKSNTTGTYIAELLDNDNNRQVSASYTISSANTWEKKTITFPADTTGVLDNDNNDSFRVTFWLAAGSNFTSGALNTAWATVVNANRAVGQVNLGAAINNYIQFTGIQPEIGPTASDFEFLPFDAQFLRCLRYYFKTFAYATAPAQNAGTTNAFQFIAGKAGALNEFGQFRLPIKMRAAPTVTFYNPSAANAQVRDVTAAADCSATAAAGSNSEEALGLNATGNAGTAVGNTLSVHVTADAEL